jgi:hypothetical protein
MIDEEGEGPPCWDQWGYSFPEHDFDRTDRCTRCGKDVEYT